MTTAPHMDVYLDMKALAALREHVVQTLGADVVAHSVAVRELTVVVPKGRVEQVLTMLRDDAGCQFSMLMDVTAVDWLGQPQAEKGRFEVVYHLLSLAKNLRIRVKAVVAEGESIPTVVGVYPAANWFEREVWDMFGIAFDGHPDLRRILTDYDFDGHPLRKDFPLTGHVEAYYDAKEQRVAYKPVDVPQELRRFDKQSEWEAMTGNAGLADGDNVFSKKDFA
ncbi:MAG: NADH-quinone oxidoreductase subunit C [Alphaproteobacteria bacterium]